MISFFLPVFIIFVIILQYHLAKSKKSTKVLDDFLDEERRANAARKKEIGPEYYVRPNIEKFPFSHNSPVPALQKAALEKAEQTMIKLPRPMTNNEIKFEFGVANLETIIAWEENLASFLRILFNWAEGLIAHEHLEEAQLVLEESVALGSEYSKCYFLLVDLYKKQNKKENLLAFYDEVSRVDFLPNNPMLKNKILTYTNLKIMN